MRSLEGEVLEEKELAPFSILPGAVRTVQSEIKLPPFGKYLLLAVLDYGSEKLLAAEAPFEIRRVVRKATPIAALHLGDFGRQRKRSVPRVEARQISSRAQQQT